MKAFLQILIFAIITLHLQPQTPTQKIYHHTFSDPTNFTIISSMDNHQPEHIFVLDSTIFWPAEIFWSGWTGDETLADILTQPGEVHESYNPDYLFRDPMIWRLFPAQERVVLRKKAEEILSVKIGLKGKNYSTIQSASAAKEFYIATAEPVFSSDGKYAFMYIEVYNKHNMPLMSPGEVLSANDSFLELSILSSKSSQTNPGKGSN